MAGHYRRRSRARRRRSGITRIPKRWLAAVLAVGLVAFSGAGGTFASFTAETTNAGSSLASGTLTMQNTVNTTTACLSSIGTGASAPTGNINGHCNGLFSLTNVEPGQWNPTTQTATVKIENTGSLNASNLWLEAPSTTDCVDTQTANGAPSLLNFNSAALDVTGVDLVANSPTATDSADFTNIAAGMSVTGPGIAAGTTVLSPTSGSASTTLTLSKPASSNESGVTLQFGAVITATVTGGSPVITTATAPSDVLAGMLVTGTDIPSGTVVESVSGTSITLSQPAGATPATDPEQLVLGGNPLCQSLLMYIQEMTTTTNGTHDYYCWYGAGSTGATTGAAESNDGLCAAPVETTLATAVTGTAATSLQLSAVTGPIYQGDTLVVTNDTGVSASYTVNSSNPSVILPVNAKTTVDVTPGSGTGTSSCTSVSSPTTTTSTTTTSTTTTTTSTTTTTTTPISFGTDSTVVDSTQNGCLNGDTTDTVANFDTLHAGSVGPLQLYPINGAGTVSTNLTTPELTAGSTGTRTFTVGVYLPNPVSNQNDLQGLQSTFGLTWYMSQ